MHRFIVLIRFTDKGARDIEQSTQRAETFDTAAEKAGVVIEGQFWTVGSYDGVLIIRTETEGAAMRCLAALVADGNVRTEVLKAFDSNEFQNFLSS